MLFWRRPPRDHDVGQCSAVVALLGRASQGHSHSIWRRATYVHNVGPIDSAQRFRQFPSIHCLCRARESHATFQMNHNVRFSPLCGQIHRNYN